MDEVTDDTDFSLPAAADFLCELLDLSDSPMLPNAAVVTYLQALHVTMPVEIALLSEAGGRLALGMSPPTQTTATSVFPVLHSLSLRLKAEDDV